MDVADIPAGLAPRDQLLYLIGRVARDSATVDMNLRSFLLRVDHGVDWQARLSQDFVVLHDDVVRIVNALPGRPEVNDAILEAIGFAVRAKWDADPLIRYVWLPEHSNETEWTRFTMMFTDETNLQAGTMHAADVCEIITQLQHAVHRTSQLNFLIPNPDGDYFFEEAITDVMKRCLGDYAGVPATFEVINAPIDDQNGGGNSP